MRKNNRKVALLICALSVLAVTASSVKVANAATLPCSTGQLRGSYAGLYTGLGGVQTDAPQTITSFTPFAISNVVVFNGKGSMAIQGSVSNGGTAVQPFFHSGTYVVNPDCTGSVAIPNPVSSLITYNFTILSSGQLNFIETDGNVAVFTLTALPPQ